MVLQDGTIPKPGSWMLFDSTEWSSFNGADEWSTEPGVHIGVTPWLAIGAATSLVDEGDGWKFLSTTPYLNVPLFKSDSVPWLRVSLYAGYELPDNKADVSSRSRSGKSGSRKQGAKTSSTATSSSAASFNKPSTSGSKKPAFKRTAPTSPSDPQRHTGGGSTGGGGPDSPGGGGGTTHDHPAAAPKQDDSETATVAEEVPVLAEPVEEGYLGIHRHGEEGLHARLIIDVDLGRSDKLMANLINFTPRTGEPAWGYAVGYRHAFHHDLAASVEAIGDFDGRGSHEALAAVHFSPYHPVTLKLGVGVGLTENSPDVSVHAGIVWRF